MALEIAARIEGAGAVIVKRLFGGAAVVTDGVQIGFVMKGSFYLRVDDASRAAFEALGSSPFAYAGGSGTVTVASYYEAPDEILEDAERLREWVANARRASIAERRRPIARRKHTS
jgi:TfoX/Sxy family transcriptional regulator of competence genes